MSSRDTANANGSSSSGGGGFASLLRAARKSTESLRSVRSNASRRKSLSEGISRASSRATNYSDAPPLPETPSEVGTPGRLSADPFGAARGAHRVRSESVTPTPRTEASNPLAASTPGATTPASSIAEQQRAAAEKAQHEEAHLEAAEDDGISPLEGSRKGLYAQNSPATSIGSLSKSMKRGTGSASSRRKGKGSLLNSANASGVSLGLQPLGEEFETDEGELRVAPGKGDGNTVAQLYAVFGLPKDPSVWTLAEEDCVAGVHHIEGAVGRFWRPEVLGCSICPSPSEVLARSTGGKTPTKEKDSGAAKWEGRGADGKKPQNPKFIEMADGRGGVERAETARVLSKALKLSFTREIEIVSGQANFPPSASSHTFSFSVPTLTSSGETLDQTGTMGRTEGRKATGAVGVSVGKANAASAVGEGYGLQRGPGASAAAGNGFGDSPDPATFYGVVLTVWSAADERRARTIKRELTRMNRQRADAKAAAANNKRNGGSGNGWSGGDTDTTGAEETAADDDGANGDGYSFLPAHNTFFMPYAICIVSRYPLYDLLGDWNKMAWHKYSRNIEMHNQQMATILRHPAPRLGEQVLIDSPSHELTFVCKFPGALEWGSGLIGIDFSMWPIFKTLSLDNILSICEIALSPNGRVLFQSRHPALLGLAVETFKHIVELRGWRGVANQNCHARDVRIYLEDPGSWIIAINTELRSIIKPAPEVCVVDLDVNNISCPRPPKHAPSTGSVRERRKRKLATGISISGVEHAPPRQYVEAYPGGRFRPLSNVQLRERNSAYEQLERPSWFDQGPALTAFDLALQDTTRSTFLQKVLRTRASKAGAASEAELAAILALRRRASTFVDARDGLENKIGRLNKRLAFLMSESEMWKQQFAKIQQLVDRLTREANDLRSKVDKERRESRRLSSTLAQRDLEQVQIQLRLKETEDAREQAQIELLKMQKAMDSLEQEREAMMDEIRNVISGAGAGEDGEFDMSRFDMYGQANRLARPSSPNGSHHSATPSQVAESIMRHRTAAEARISEGRGSRAASRNGHEARGKEGSQDGERKGADGSSQVHHFPDDQMNQEIQARTNVVTDQISRIQQQLESTLTNLEGRRSGTYERSERRRDRRTSNASISSMRYEYGIPSSIGHGGMASESESHYRAPSSVGGGGGGGMTTDDDNYSDMDYAMESARKREKRLARQERREKRLAAGPSAYKAVTPSASSGNLSQAAATPPSSSGIEPAQAASSPLPTGTPTRPPPRERKPSNPWKQQSSAPTPKDSPEFISAPGTPGSHAGDTSNPAIDATPGLGAQSNGHAANGKDVDATPRQQVKA